MMSRRLLVVSPHFPPVNAPDCQRVRMALPHLPGLGWTPHVLAVDPAGVEGFLDPDLALTVPPDVPVTRVPALPPRLTRRLGFGGLWLRAGRQMARAGTDLLRRGRFDLVYFSTTVFAATRLGPVWRRRFGVPYVVDLQDPWVSDYYRRTGVRPPGGRVRYAVAQWQARRDEPRVVRGAAHVITVSPGYVTDLRARYPDVPADRFTVLPFGASDADFEAAERAGVGHGVFDPADGLRHWVYLGRGGPDMGPALRGLFTALADLRRTTPGAGRLRLHFVGTSYAPKGLAGLADEAIRPVAAACGVADLVDERTDRLPYLSGLALLRAADAVLIIGSDDPAYSASKVYPCVLARRPLLAVLHAESPAAGIITRCRAGTVVGFTGADAPAGLAGRLKPVLARMLAGGPGRGPDTDWDAFTPYTVRETTRAQCRVFDAVVRGRPAAACRVGGGR